MRKIIGLLGVLGVMWMMWTMGGIKEVRAQSLSLGISPPVLEVMIKPGKSRTRAYRLKNDGERVVVNATIVAYSENGIKEDAEFNPEPWITLLNTDIFFNKPFLMAAGEEKQIVLRLAPPLNYPESDLYRVLLFSTSYESVQQYSQSSINQKIGTIILANITPTGLIPKSAQLIQFDLPRILDSFGPLVAKLSVKNTGKTFFRPLGKLVLTGGIGKASFKINPNIILPGTTKGLGIEGEERNRNSPTLSVPGLYLGKYALTTSFTLDEGTIKLEQTKTFYAIPWKAGVLGVLGSLGVVWIRRRKRKNAKNNIS